MSNYLCPSYSQQAAELSRLDARMRSARNCAALARACIAFIFRAVELRAVNRLNSLADFCANSDLSERSLDLVFEGESTDVVIRALLERARSEPAFADALQLDFGEECVEKWRCPELRQEWQLSLF